MAKDPESVPRVTEAPEALGRPTAWEAYLLNRLRYLEERVAAYEKLFCGPANHVWLHGAEKCLCGKRSLSGFPDA